MVQEINYNKIFTNLPEDKEAFFKDLSEKYPYFSLSHFYYLKSKNNFDKSAETDMALLHFNSPFLLNHRLKQKEDITSIIKSGEEKAVHEADITSETNRVEEIKERELEIPGLGDLAARLKTESTNNDAPGEVLPIAFEPLHTTDYFASQGIKLSEEVKAEDKLGKQLRSFTDWLKTMKKVEGNTVSDPAIDVSIQKIAENSNKDQQIITESMAEVYISQGKFKKASEVFKKLSLLNPDKSAYFAAKLESLKDK